MPIKITWTPQATVIVGSDWSVSMQSVGSISVATVTRLAAGWPRPECCTSAQPSPREALRSALDGLSGGPTKEMNLLLDGEGLVAFTEEIEF